MRAARLRPDIPVSRLAELSVAYETLRDPARRRAYDASLGLDRAAKPDAPSPLAPAELRVAAFIATSLREPATPPQAQAVADPVPQPRAAAEPEVVAAKAAGLLIDRRGSTVAAGAVGLAVLALALSLPQQNPDRIAAATEPVQAVTVGLPPAAPVAGLCRAATAFSGGCRSAQAGSGDGSRSRGDSPPPRPSRRTPNNRPRPCPRWKLQLSRRLPTRWRHRQTRRAARRMPGPRRLPQPMQSCLCRLRRLHGRSSGSAMPAEAWPRQPRSTGRPARSRSPVRRAIPIALRRSAGAITSAAGAGC